MLLAGRYECLQMLKSGNGVETYLANDLETATQVVVKVLLADQVAPAVRIRLEHEAAVLARMSKGSFKPLLDYGAEGETVFLV